MHHIALGAGLDLIGKETLEHFYCQVALRQVTDFREESWFDRAGNYHSDALKVTERFTPMSPSHLSYEATIDDPNVFTRPWKITIPLYKRVERNLQLMEFNCVPFSEDLIYGQWKRR